MIKLIASDMDGTLLNEKLAVSSENALAIKRAQKAGIHFLVATGRTYETGYPLLEERGIHSAFIALNGAQIYDENGNVQSVRELSRQTLSQALDILQKYPIQTDIVTDQGTYTRLNFQEYATSVAQDLAGINPDIDLTPYIDEILTYVRQLNLVHVDSFDSLIADNKVRPLKIVLITSDDTVRAQVEAEVKAQMPTLSVTSATPTNLEINSRAANKGDAIAHYADHLGLDASEVAVIGDSLNDLSMMKWAGYSFAVDNAIPIIKEVAQYQTVSHQDHAVARVIDDILDGKYH